MQPFFLGVIGLYCSIGLFAQTSEPKVIRYAVADSPPMATVDDKHPAGLKGLYPDILDAVLTKRMGLSWTGTTLPWKRAQAEVQSGGADILITVPTEERRVYALASDQPVFEAYLHVYTYADHPRILEIRKIKTAEDIRRLGLIPVTNLGNNWHRENIDAIGIKTHYAPADQNIARFLAAKRADIMIDMPFTMNPMIKSLGLTRQIEMTPARFGPIGFHVLVGRKSPFSSSMTALNRAIDQFILDGTRERLSAKYLRE
jgi:polar amino acid transport system substrate-binding protein